MYSFWQALHFSSYSNILLIQLSIRILSLSFFNICLWILIYHQRFSNAFWMSIFTFWFIYFMFRTSCLWFSFSAANLSVSVFFVRTILSCSSLTDFYKSEHSFSNVWIWFCWVKCLAYQIRLVLLRINHPTHTIGDATLIQSLVSVDLISVLVSNSN